MCYVLSPLQNDSSFPLWSPVAPPSIPQIIGGAFSAFVGDDDDGDDDDGDDDDGDDDDGDDDDGDDDDGDDDDGASTDAGATPPFALPLPLPPSLSASPTFSPTPTATWPIFPKFALRYSYTKSIILILS